MSPEVRRSSKGRRIRRLRRVVERHPRRTAAVVVLAVLVLFGLWASWRAWSIARDLDTAAKKAEVMRAALERADVPGARRALAEFQDAASGADSGSSGPTWGLLEHLPFLGDDARGVATMSSVLDDIGQKGLPPVMGAAGQVTGTSFEPHGHRFPLARIAALQAPARASEASFASAAQRLGAVDSSGFVGPFRARFDQLRTLVGTARDTLGSTYRAARMMPDLLGAHGPRTYILVMENNAELRSMGGLAGSLSVVRAEGGHVRIVDQDDMANFPGQPHLRLKPDEQRLFGNLLRITGVNATMTPDAPRAAELVRDRWVANHGGRIDGVFFVDPVAVSYLMHGLGTVPVPGYPSINWATVVPAVENTVYLDTPDRQLQSDYQNAVAKAVFDAFAEGQGDPVTAIRGLVRGVAEGRVRMHTFVPADQRQIAGTAIAGELPTKPTVHPQAGVYLNDSTESKMSYYLQYDAAVVPTTCADGLQEASGRLTLTNAVPPQLAKLPLSVTGWGDRTRHIRKGQQYVVAYLTSPIGGSLESLEIDGRTVTPAIVRYAGREVVGVGVNLAPHATHTVTWTLRSGLRQSGGWQVSVTPGSRPGTFSGTVPSAC